MAEFDWSKIPKAKSTFNWDDHRVVSPAPPAHEKPWFSGEGFARGAIDTIPAAGMLAGGVIGAPLGPAGSVGGAGLGYAGGKELSDTLKNRLLGDQPTSVDPVEQAKRVVGNAASGASMEMGGQVLPVAAGMAKNVIDDIATTPLGPTEATSGTSPVGHAMQTAQNIGAKGNAFLDKLTPKSGNKNIDQMLRGITHVGRYGVSSAAQGALDGLEHGPKAAQYLAEKASGGIDNFLLKSPRMHGLFQSSPQAFKALSSSLSQRTSANMPKVAGPTQEPVDDDQAKQSFLNGN